MWLHTPTTQCSQSTKPEHQEWPSSDHPIVAQRVRPDRWEWEVAWWPCFLEGSKLEDLLGHRPRFELFSLGTGPVL